MAIMQERRSVTSGNAIIKVGNYECEVVGDAPVEELRSKLSYQDPKIAAFLRTGKWSEVVDKELDILKRLAAGETVVDENGQAVDALRYQRNRQQNQGRRQRQRADEDPDEQRMDGDNAGKLKSKFVGEALKDARRAANTVYLYDTMTKTFPTTLLKSVLRIFRYSGIKYVIQDEREVPKPAMKAVFNPLDHEQRDYQDQAVRVGAFCRCGTFAMATNAGKTDVMLRIIERRPIKTLIVVQKQELLGQITDAIRRHFGVEPGSVGAGDFFLQPITVAIVNSAHLRIKELTEYGFKQVFVDEGHHGASRVHFTVLRELKPYATYSMTGTDFRANASENVVLKAAFGGTIFRVSNQFMTDSGYSAKMVADIVDCRQEIHPSFSWGAVYNTAIINSERRTRTLVDLVIEHVKSGRTVLVLTEQVPHGRTILGYLESAGIDARFMHGSRTREERAAARAEFRDRKFQVLVGTTIYDEGVDFPTLDVVAFAGGKKAKGKVLQRIGRGQRRGLNEDGSRKDVAYVIDVFDDGHRLLRRHSLRRLLAMHDAGVVLPRRYERLLFKEGLIHEDPGSATGA